MKRTYNKTKTIIKFITNWNMSKIVEFVNRQLAKGAKIIEDYTTQNGRISFVLQYS